MHSDTGTKFMWNSHKRHDFLLGLLHQNLFLSTLIQKHVFIMWNKANSWNRTVDSPFRPVQCHCRRPSECLDVNSRNTRAGRHGWLMRMRPRVETEDRKDGGTDTQGKVIPSPQGHQPPYQNQKQTQCGAGKKKKKKSKFLPDYLKEDQILSCSLNTGTFIMWQRCGHIMKLCSQFPPGIVGPTPRTDSYLSYFKDSMITSRHSENNLKGIVYAMRKLTSPKCYRTHSLGLVFRLPFKY